MRQTWKMTRELKTKPQIKKRKKKKDREDREWT